jgi:pantothenate kinase
MHTFKSTLGGDKLGSCLPPSSRQTGHVAPQVRTRNEVLLPSFQHGVGDPVEDNIVVATHHTLVLVEGNYLLIGTPTCILFW